MPTKQRSSRLREDGTWSQQIPGGAGGCRGAALSVQPQFPPLHWLSADGPFPEELILTQQRQKLEALKQGFLELGVF